MTSRNVLAPILLAAAVTACGCASITTEPPPDAWQRIYGAPLEDVWQAALELLVDEGYVVESEDRGRGRIVAQSTSGREYRELALVIEIFQSGELVKVLIDARVGAGEAGTWRQLDRAIPELLTLLDERVRATRP